MRRSPTGKLASWLTSLFAVLQKLVLRSAWLCVLVKPAEAAGVPPLWSPHLPRARTKGLPREPRGQIFLALAVRDGQDAPPVVFYCTWILVPGLF
jgi:hypothetical protein